jgi:hypothetical protein
VVVETPQMLSSFTLPPDVLDFFKTCARSERLSVATAIGPCSFTGHPLEALKTGRTLSCVVPSFLSSSPYAVQESKEDRILWMRMVRSENQGENSETIMATHLPVSSRPSTAGISRIGVPGSFQVFKPTQDSDRFPGGVVFDRKFENTEKPLTNCGQGITYIESSIQAFELVRYRYNIDDIGDLLCAQGPYFEYVNPALAVRPDLYFPTCLISPIVRLVLLYLYNFEYSADKVVYSFETSALL